MGHPELKIKVKIPTSRKTGETWGTRPRNRKLKIKIPTLTAKNVVRMGHPDSFLHSSVQNLSLRYLSPESQRMVTITAS
jgi:hypothetical protein